MSAWCGGGGGALCLDIARSAHGAGAGAAGEAVPVGAEELSPHGVVVSPDLGQPAEV